MMQVTVPNQGSTCNAGHVPRVEVKDLTLPILCVNSETIEHVTTYKYLGLHLDNQLNWKCHIENVCKKVNQRIGVLKRIRQYLDRDTALQLHNALITPIIDYCHIVYTNGCKQNLARIEKLIYKSGKVLLNVPYDTSNCTVIQVLNWLLPAE